MKLSRVIICIVLIFGISSIYAQNSQEKSNANKETTNKETLVEENNTDKEEDVVELGPVVTTGTRLLRETYESISPVQVITAEEARAVGQFSAADILQNSPAATGQQIDLSFTGFALENGPGSQTLSFRGLGANRTLIMLNGRRLGASGGEGAPIAPDLNMIPGGLVERYELLLDGASSIYGSDAVAGVANAILRNDFNGLEVDFSTTIPEQSEGVEERLGLTWGKNFERGFIGVGIELSDTEEIKVKDRSWTNHCPRNVEIDENGEIRNLANNFLLGSSDCFVNSPLIAASLITGTINRNFYYLDDFDGISIFAPLGFISNDGSYNLENISPYSLHDYQTGTSLFGELKTQHLMSYGEYTFDGDNAITPFFEISYGRRDTFQGTEFNQLYPKVPVSNPFVSSILVIGADSGIGDDLGEIIAPVLAVKQDRDQVSATVEQTRVVLGVNGEVPQMNISGMSNWNFESYIAYTESDARMVRPGIRNDRLDYSLQTSRIDPVTGDIICGNNDGCVPINIFAPSLYQLPIGDLATQEERDYLFDSRIINTNIKQHVFSTFINGYLYELPAGPLALGFGFELREDSINSTSNDVAQDGLFFIFPTDSGTFGSKYTREAFAEVEFPLLKGRKGVDELTLNLSGRLTKDELYPSNSTYSFKLGYRPIDSLLLKATVGTSYRAPNIREVFLGRQDEAIISGTGTAAGILCLENFPNSTTCSDYTLVNVNPNIPDDTLFGTNIIEITSGNSEIIEEKADTFTYGIAWEVPNLDNYNITMGATYYQMEVGDTVIKPTPNFILNSCYLGSSTNNPICSRITRFGRLSGNISSIDTSFLNRANQTVKGVDVNLNMDTNIYLFNQSIDIGLDMSMNHTSESSETLIDDDGNLEFVDHNGEFGFPNWAGTMTLWTRVKDLKFTWQTYYMGRVRQNLNDARGFSDTSEFTQGDFELNHGIGSNTCSGPEFGDVLCRNVDFVNSYTYHTASVYYNDSNWSIGFGIRNVFNKNPPQIDPSTFSSTVSNVPLGVGYDLNGRRFFLNVKRHF